MNTLTAIAKECDPIHGFAFDCHITRNIGFLHSLKIQNLGLMADTYVANPLDCEGYLPIAASIESISWDLTPNGVIHMKFFISSCNRRAISSLALRTMSQASVDFDFTVYEYSKRFHSYLKTFYSYGEVKGILKNEKTDLAFNIANFPSQRIRNVEVYEVSFWIQPMTFEQKLFVSTPKATITQQLQAK